MLQPPPPPASLLSPRVTLLLERLAARLLSAAVSVGLCALADLALGFLLRQGHSFEHVVEVLCAGGSHGYGLVGGGANLLQLARAHATAITCTTHTLPATAWAARGDAAAMVQALLIWAAEHSNHYRS